MKHLKFAIIAATAALLGISTAHAAIPIAVQLGIGTEGIGATVYTSLIPKTLDLSIGYSRFDYSHDFTADSTNFKGTATLGGVPLLATWFPLHNNFGIQGGLVINQNQIKATATPDAGGVIDINHTLYTAAEVGTLTGKTHFNRVAPYLGVAYGNPFDGGKWTFNASAGALFEGSSNATLTASNPAANPMLTADLASTQASINHKTNYLSVWPVIAIGVSYRF